MENYSTREIFIKSVVGMYVPACDVPYRLEVFLPCAISQMKALLSPLAITSRLPFLVISAWLSLTVATKSRLFKVSSCFPLFQVQALPFFSKPMCHAPVFQKERFLISWLKNCHSSSISIETKSAPWCLQTFLLFC